MAIGCPLVVQAGKTKLSRTSPSTTWVSSYRAMILCYNILMDIEDKHPGYTHIALTVSSLESARSFVATHGIAITGSFSFGDMSAIFIRDPDRNVIELDAYGSRCPDDTSGYANHPR